ncbi:TonB-dependent receptor [Paenibacillus sp. J31TS4]|uniref:MetQ/NlpA family ABC transporter substrate-binding protein n=1 Tax=Paenibacillus sp. J31TS4 TaxID=2807195 RepID=UPI001B255F14|nr:MetQ/NlpA family ABC transporter substrate-binding protein [Paenibacillus sp. J31TS4]GIP40061.1 TonB-dependent receptor [Paenibacillus sp. J31TS4]
MKKSLLLVFTLVFSLSLVLAGCGSKSNDSGSAGTSPSPSASAGGSAAPVKLKVGATARPHAEILNFLKPQLEKQGVQLEVKEYTDYVQPNVQLNDKELDANFFQHQQYLDQFNKDRKTKLVKVVGVHIEPLGAYSKKIKAISELKDGAKVAIPNDVTNAGRALGLLEQNGLLKLKEGVGSSATIKDIVDNPKKLEVKELEAALLPRVIDEFDLAIINTNFALNANLQPTKDALFMEKSDSPYVNILVSREDNKDSEAMKKLAAALTSSETKKFIEEKYKGEVLPAF